jgi:hypothetical protein
MLLDAPLLLALYPDVELFPYRLILTVPALELLIGSMMFDPPLALGIS